MGETIETNTAHGATRSGGGPSMNRRDFLRRCVGGSVAFAGGVGFGGGKGGKAETAPGTFDTFAEIGDDALKEWYQKYGGNRPPEGWDSVPHYIFNGLQPADEFPEIDRIHSRQTMSELFTGAGKSGKEKEKAKEQGFELWMSTVAELWRDGLIDIDGDRGTDILESVKLASQQFELIFKKMGSEMSDLENLSGLTVKEAVRAYYRISTMGQIPERPATMAELALGILMWDHDQLTKMGINPGYSINDPIYRAYTDRAGLHQHDYLNPFYYGCEVLHEEVEIGGRKYDVYEDEVLNKALARHEAIDEYLEEHGNKQDKGNDGSGIGFLLKPLLGMAVTTQAPRYNKPDSWQSWSTSEDDIKTAQGGITRRQFFTRSAAALALLALTGVGVTATADKTIPLKLGKENEENAIELFRYIASMYDRLTAWNSTESKRDGDGESDEAFPSGSAVRLSVRDPKTGETIDTLGFMNETFHTPEGNVPSFFRKCLIGLEDHNFLKHDGVDTKGLIRGALHRAGTSTLTMELIENMLRLQMGDEVYEERAQKRGYQNVKFEEIYLATMLERYVLEDMARRYPGESEKELKKRAKRKIMEMYVNFVPFGTGREATGLTNGALTYFDIDPDRLHELTPREQLALAILPNRPWLLSDYVYVPDDVKPEDREQYIKRHLQERHAERNKLIFNMAKYLYNEGKINKNELDVAIDEGNGMPHLRHGSEQVPPIYDPTRSVKPVYRDFVRYTNAIVPDLSEKLSGAGGGEVVLTVDPEIQQIIAEEAAKYEKEHPNTEVRVMVTDPRSGDALAVQGKTAEYDFPPGSVAKLPLYGELMARYGYDLDTILNDPTGELTAALLFHDPETGEPIYHPWIVHNDGYNPEKGIAAIFGSRRLAELLAQSCNVVPAFLSLAIGAVPINMNLDKYGLTDNSQPGEMVHSAVLGTRPTSLGRLARLASSITNRGLMPSRKVINEIRGRKGKDGKTEKLYEHWTRGFSREVGAPQAMDGLERILSTPENFPDRPIWAPLRRQPTRDQLYDEDGKLIPRHWAKTGTSEPIIHDDGTVSNYAQAVGGMFHMYDADGNEVPLTVAVSVRFDHASDSGGGLIDAAPILYRVMQRVAEKRGLVYRGGS